MLEWLVPALLLMNLLTICIAAYSLHLSIQSQILVKGLQSSTHAVQMVPIPTDAEDEVELNKRIRRADAEAYEDLSDMEATGLPL